MGSLVTMYKSDFFLQPEEKECTEMGNFVVRPKTDIEQDLEAFSDKTDPQKNICEVTSLYGSRRPQF